MDVNLVSPDIRVALDALLSLTYNDPDRVRVERLILQILGSGGADPQLRALAVTCIGYVARIHRAVDPGLIEVARSLLDDATLGGIAEDAVADAEFFAELR